jgi:protein TonB
VRARAEGDYLAELQRAIKRHQRYPDRARSEGREGSTTLTFVLLADGGMEAVKVARTSGDRELDRAAIEALKRLNRFRPIPLEFGRRRWPLSVSIRFDLR